MTWILKFHSVSLMSSTVRLLDSYRTGTDICICTLFLDIFIYFLLQVVPEFSLTDLQLSQSESFVSKLRNNHWDRLLLGEEHRDGGRRKEAELLTSSFTSPSPSTPTDKQLLPFVSLLFMSTSPGSLSSWARVLRFLADLAQIRRLRGSGLDDGDQESLSDDGGRTFSIGMGMGLAIERVWINPCVIQRESASLRDLGF